MKLLLFISVVTLGLMACDGNIVTPENQPPDMPPTIPFVCDDSTTVDSLESVLALYKEEGHSILKTCAGGTCHDSDTGRLFRMNAASPAETFYRARADGFFLSQFGSITDRLRSDNPDTLMPPNNALDEGDILALETIACLVQKYEESDDAVAPDEEYPRYLLEPWSGGVNTVYNNRFLNYQQLRGRTEGVFGRNWATAQEPDRFAANIDLLGGADFVNTFQQASAISAEYLLALGGLKDDMCRAAANNQDGPFDQIAVDAEIAAGGTLESQIGDVYSRMLFRPASTTEKSEATLLLIDLTADGTSSRSAWRGLCEALVQHPEYLLVRSPATQFASPEDKPRLQLVQIATTLLARIPTFAEFEKLDESGIAAVVDDYLSSTDFRDYFFHAVRLRTESAGDVLTDEPARLWTYLVMNNLPIKDLFVAEYSVNENWEMVSRPVEHGATGILTMKGYMQGKPGLPGYNYPARVMGDFMGVIFDVPSGAGQDSSAASTVDPTSVCYACHRNLTPLAYQRLRWDDDGNYSETDENGDVIDDTDRGLVANYRFAGAGLGSFSANAIRKEAFIRRMIDVQFKFMTGRVMRADEDERALYKELWDLTVANGNSQDLIKAIILSPAFSGN